MKRITMALMLCACGAAGEARSPDGGTPIEAGIAQGREDGAQPDGLPLVGQDDRIEPDGATDGPPATDLRQERDSFPADAWLDPLAPFPSSTCPGSDAWRIPRGTCLWVWGRYTLACGTTDRGSCATISHVRQCDTVGFQGECIEGDMVATIGDYTPIPVGYRVERHPVVNGICSKACP